VKTGLSFAAAAVGCLTCLAGPARAGDVSVTLTGGRVTIVAHNATPRQILEAWARQGHTRIVNVERVGGAPDTLLLTNEPEEKALAVLLRSVSGYIAAPRRVPMPNASQYDRILIMPPSFAAAAPAYRAAAPQPVQQPVFEPPPDPTSLANDENPGPAAPPVFQPGDGNPPPPSQANPPAQNPLTPYVPPPADSNGEQPQGPPTQPTPGQLTTPSPGVLPVPPTPPQPPQPR
jgi:hypothetical protein